MLNFLATVLLQNPTTLPVHENVDATVHSGGYTTMIDLLQQLCVELFVGVVIHVTLRNVPIISDLARGATEVFDSAGS